MGAGDPTPAGVRAEASCPLPETHDDDRSPFRVSVEEEEEIPHTPYRVLFLLQTTS
jgi:hypothetical protein